MKNHYHKPDSLVAQEQKTAKNGLTFTGTPVTSLANDRGHTHTINAGNTSSSGTITTAGFRGVSVITTSTINTDNTSAKTLTGTGDGYQIGNSVQGEGSGNKQYQSSGIIKYSKGSKTGTSAESNASIKISIDATHRHELTAGGYLYGKTDGESQDHTHSVTASGTISGDAETRPINYTILIWKRVS